MVCERYTHSRTISGSVSAPVSALRAASLRVNTTANNIANARTVGRPGATDPSEQVFQPQDVVQSSLSTGGVTARTIDRRPGSSPAFDPGNSLANAQGLVDSPNVDLASELVDFKTAEVSFKAAAALIRAEDERTEALLDIKT